LAINIFSKKKKMKRRDICRKIYLFCNEEIG